MTRTSVFALWVCGGVAASACTTLLGDDYEVVGSAGMSGVERDASDKDGSMTEIDAGCDAAEADCRLCEPGSFACSGADLQQCAEDGDSYMQIMTCVTSALCDATLGECLPPVCQPNTFQCNGAQLETCSPTQDGWTFITPCQSAAHCDASAGLCRPEPCVAGEYQCSGADLRVCNETQTDWTFVETCPSQALCNEVDGNCSDAVCSPGTFQCAGNVLTTCNPTQTGWQNVATCASSTLCNAGAGICDPPVCELGQFNCAGASLQTCRGDQSGWSDALTCASEAHCDAQAGMCRAQPCMAGEYQCSGSMLQRCNAAQTGWDDVSPCATPALCDEDQELCHPPVCEPGDYQCVGAELQSCNAGRTGFQTAATCSNASLCDAANGQCDTCTPGAHSCQGASLLRCAADGQSSPVIQTCGSAAQCDAANGRCASSTCPATGRGPAMVHLGTFCIDSTEVTNTQYAAFVNSNPSTAGQPARCSWNTSYVQAEAPFPGEENWPATNVDWCDAYAFCAWAGKHLCGKIGGGPNGFSDYANASSSAWYSACVSGSAGYLYPYGNTYSSLACNGYDNTNFTSMAPVRGAAGCHSNLTPYSGVYDLSGNAEEWEDSCTEGGSADVDQCRLRGGRYTDDPAWLRCNVPYEEDRSHTHFAIGFRCCSP